MKLFAFLTLLSVLIPTAAFAQSDDEYGDYTSSSYSDYGLRIPVLGTDESFFAVKFATGDIYGRCGVRMQLLTLKVSHQQYVLAHCDGDQAVTRTINEEQANRWIEKHVRPA